MKALAFAIMLSAFSTSAMARSMKKVGFFDFAGKFTAEMSDCGGNVAYGSLARNKQNRVIGVNYSIYGNDPTGFGISVGETKEKNTNYEYGNPIEYTIYKGFWEGNVLKATRTYIYGKTGRKEHVQTETLELTETGVLYKDYDEKGKLYSSCNLIRAQSSEK